MENPKVSKMKPLEGTESRIAEIAVPIFNTLINAHRIQDYEMFVALLSDEVKEDTTKKRFKAAIKDDFTPLGEIKDTIYLGCVRKGGHQLTSKS